MAKFFKRIFEHKIITGLSLAAIIAGGYFAYQGLFKSDQTTRYVIAAAEKGTLIVSVSGSGQVSASNQLDIKPKVSGDAVSIAVKEGQEVKANGLLVQIDSADAQKAVRDAETALETAKLELDDLLEPLDELTLLQAEDSLLQAQQSKQKAEDNVKNGYEDAFNSMTDVFLELPTIMTSARDILYSNVIAKSELSLDDSLWNRDIYQSSFASDDRNKIDPLVSAAENKYKIAKEKYDQNFADYRSASRYSKEEIIEALLNETIEDLKSVAEAIKSERNMIDGVVDYLSERERRIYSQITGYQSDIKSYTTKINSQISSLMSIQRTLQDNKSAVESAERTIREKELSLEKTKQGADDLAVRAKKIAVQQKEDALLNAKQNLADYSVRAPFDGVAVDVSVKKGDSLSSGTVLMTLITKQRIAEITVNEVDAVKIKTGQKTTITFDAIDGLAITGQVAEIDALATVSQGVVTYNVKIAFDTQDERIKPGMSISVAIITDVKQDALLVPNAAVRQQAGSNYVQVASGVGAGSDAAAAGISGIIIPDADLSQKQVQIGLSNDTMTEIVSGLNKGEQVVTRTITSNSAQSQSSSNTGFRLPGVSSGSQVKQIIR